MGARLCPWNLPASLSTMFGIILKCFAAHVFIVSSAPVLAHPRRGARFELSARRVPLSIQHDHPKLPCGQDVFSRTTARVLVSDKGFSYGHRCVTGCRDRTRSCQTMIIFISRMFSHSDTTFCVDNLTIHRLAQSVQTAFSTGNIPWNARRDS